MLPVPLPLLASLAVQAGGGGSFSGGGGGGSGGGGDDGWGLAFWLVRLAVEDPLLGVPLIVGLLLVLIVGSRLGWFQHQRRTIRRTGPLRDDLVSARLAARLRASDPLFDEARFLGRAARAFRLAQDAWCRQELEPLSAFVSDGVFERFSLQVEEQRRDGWRQGMDGLHLGEPSIAHVEVGTEFESVTVHLPFEADIHRLSLADGTRLRGSGLPTRSFSEHWSFVRRRGTRSLAGEGLIEGKCPNCAAPLAMNRAARCAYCQCLARSGRFDWVLAEITQSSEWRPERDRIPGLAAYLVRDPGMSPQMLEDRASVAFWRWVAAGREGRVDPLVRIADEALCRGTAEELARTPSTGRTFPADCAVGSVRTLGLLAGPEGAVPRATDRAVVEIVWDSRRGRSDPAGDSAGDSAGRLVVEGPRRLARSLFVFARAAGATTDLDEAFTTASCRSCGAHDPGGTAPACPWCNAPRRGGPSEWLLTDVLAAGSPEASLLRRELDALEDPPVVLSPHSSSDLIAWCATLAASDGRIDERERLAVHSLAERLGVPAWRVDLGLAQPPAEASLSTPRTEPEARLWFDELLRIAFSDGHMAPAERRLLSTAATRLPLDGSTFTRLLTNTRATLYRESREARRQSRARGARPDLPEARERAREASREGRIEKDERG